MTRGGRWAFGAVAFGLSIWVSGCADLQARVGPALSLKRGESGLAAELDRLRAPGPFRYDEIGRDQAVVVARGRRVVLRAVEGLCLTQGAMDVSQEAAFAVVADCIGEDGAAIDAAAGTLPPSFGGLLAISISGEPMFAGETGRATALRRLRDFLGTAPGLALLGRNGSGASVELVDARQIGDALYVHVHDSQEDALALFAPGFWRAFVELNGRLAMVTVSGFRDLDVEPEAMLSLLAGQLAELRRVNGGAAFQDEINLAEGAGAALSDVRLAATDPTEGLEDLRGQLAARKPAPRQVPVPSSRPGAGSSQTAAVDQGTRLAPETAPLAPPRPGVG
ncbi:MAG: hypothetical protein AAGC57_20440 [Pseudomonadota bacterium]